MLASIHPLGERARNNRWTITAGAFGLASVAAAAGFGGLLGWIGSLALSGGALSEMAGQISIGAILIGAGIADALGWPVPGPARQVNERWIGHYRGWVYGVGFGAQLGVGVTTHVVTWGTYAVVATALLAAEPLAGVVVMGGFGLGRSVSTLAAGWIDRPDRVTVWHRQMMRIAPTAHRISAAGLMVLGLATLALAVMTG